MIRANDTWKFWWDIAILLFAIFNSLFIPLQLCFEEFRVDLEDNMLYYVIDQMGNVFFIMDIIFQMNTSYYNQEGEEIIDKKKIRIHYVTGMFFVDLLSSIPIGDIFPGSALEVINILKIIRIKRLTRIIDKMNADEERKSIYRMLQLVFYLFLMMHIVGCLWNIIVHAD